MSDALDLSAYERDGLRHALRGAMRERLLDEYIDAQGPDDCGWTLAEGKFRVGACHYELQVLGTYSDGDDTFLWAWDHPDASEWHPDALRVAKELHALATKPGYAVFGQRKVSQKWVPYRELLWVAGELADGEPIYRWQGEAGPIIALQVRGLPLPDVAQFPQAFLAGTLLDFQHEVMLPVRECVRPVLASMGTISEAGPNLRVDTPHGGFISLTFDAGERLVTVEDEWGPKRPR